MQTDTRDLSGLTPALIGAEGWRIEARYPDGTKARYYVSRSSGWRPCHIALKTTRATGGFPVDWPAGTTFVLLYQRSWALARRPPPAGSRWLP